MAWSQTLSNAYPIHEKYTLLIHIFQQAESKYEGDVRIGRVVTEDLDRI